MKRSALLFLAAVAACDGREAANESAPTNAATPAPEPVARGHLGQAYGISEAEAEVRRANEERVSALSMNLRRDDPLPGFSTIWIRHEPDYAVVVDFKGEPDVEAVRARADPALRQFLVFRSVARSQSDIERDMDRIIAAMRGGPKDWTAAYEVETGKFLFNAPAPATLAYADKRLPPDLRKDVILRVASIPVPLAR